MKKITTLLLSLSTMATMAQVVFPNADLEGWQTSTSGPSEDPVGWNTINGPMFELNALPSVTKVTDKFSGTYAANIKNVSVSKGSSDTLFGGYMFTDIDITGKQLPAYLRGHVKYSLAAGEKAVIMFGYKTMNLDGTITQYVLGMKTFEGSTTSYVPFSVPTNAFFYPNRLSNTLSIGISSYNFWADNAVAVSSSSNLTIDSLSFVGTVAPPVIAAGNTISNGDFSVWDDASTVKLPKNWFLASSLQQASTSAVNQSTDAHTGAYALELGIDPSSLPTAVYTFLKPSAGSKFVQGYAKFDLAPKDTVMAILSKYTSETGLDGEWVDSVVFTGSQSQYKAFSLAFNGKVSESDTLVLQFVAFNPAQLENFRLGANSTFLLDDVTVSATPLALTDEQLAATSWTVSPNPSANGVFTLRSTQKLDQLQVFDVLGNKVDANIRVGQETATLDISQHARGIYYVTQQKENSKYTSRIVY